MSRYFGVACSVVEPKTKFGERYIVFPGQKVYIRTKDTMTGKRQDIYDAKATVGLREKWAWSS